MCAKGPVVIIHPQNLWYQEVDEKRGDAILDALENGTVAEEYLLE